MRAFRWTGRLLLAMVTGALAVPLAAQLASAAPPPPPGCGDATPEAVAEYFDRTLPDRLATNRVPGASVSVVSGGRTVFTKGYGLSDVEHNTPFSPTESLVRIASISKLFTWTAVMQQVEAGRLDLNADVNTYLKDFQVPATFPAPVTLQDLMNHTAGFENYIIGTGARTAEDVVPLGAYLAAHMPRRIYPPGEVNAYSNYGAALAGYIVAQVSGEPYDAYIAKHILAPLGMDHSTASEPVPATLAGGLARSYNTDMTPTEVVPFQFDNLAPDGSVSATAADMAAFMNAHLHSGPILQPATMALMHQRSFGADPRLGGYAHGFQDRIINGHRVLMHDGSWEAFLSVLVLVPDCDLGFFITTNGTGGVDASLPIVQGFFDTFAPATTATGTPGPSTVGNGTAVTTPQAGFYQLTRHNESGLEKIVNLLGPARLTLDADGTVHFRGKTWTAQADGLYAENGGTDRLVFLTGTGGRRYVATNGPTYELMSSDETLPVNLVVLAVFAVPALTVLALPLVALVRRIRRRPVAMTVAWRLARALAGGAALLAAVFLVGLTLVLAGDTGDYIYGAPFGFLVLLSLPVVALTAAAASAGLTVRSWRGSGAGLTARIHQVVLLAAMLPLGWFLWQWNLIGWQV